MDPKYKPHCSTCKPLRQAILMGKIGNAYFHDVQASREPMIWHNGPGGLNYFYLSSMEHRSYTAEDKATLRNLWRMAVAAPPSGDCQPTNKLQGEPLERPEELSIEGGPTFVAITSSATTGLLHYRAAMDRHTLPTRPDFSNVQTFHYIGTLQMRDGSALHDHDIYYRQPSGNTQAALGSFGYRPETGISRRSWNEWVSVLCHETDDNWAEMMREIMRWMLTPEGEAVVRARLEHQGLTYVPLTNYSMER